MRIVMAAVLAGGLALAGCSEQTQDSASEAAKSAAADAASNTSEVLDKGGYKLITRILASDWSKLAQASN